MKKYKKIYYTEHVVYLNSKYKLRAKLTNTFNGLNINSFFNDTSNTKQVKMFKRPEDPPCERAPLVPAAVYTHKQQLLALRVYRNTYTSNLIYAYLRTACGEI